MLSLVETLEEIEAVCKEFWLVGWGWEKQSVDGLLIL